MKWKNVGYTSVHMIKTFTLREGDHIIMMNSSFPWGRHGIVKLVDELVVWQISSMAFALISCFRLLFYSAFVEFQHCLRSQRVRFYRKGYLLPQSVRCALQKRRQLTTAVLEKFLRCCSIQDGNAVVSRALSPAENDVGSS